VDALKSSAHVQRRIQHIDKQTQRESRKLWLHVTRALNAGDYQAATHHRTLVQRQQRALIDSEMYVSENFTKTSDGVYLAHDFPQ